MRRQPYPPLILGIASKKYYSNNIIIHNSKVFEYNFSDTVKCIYLCIINTIIKVALNCISYYYFNDVSSIH